MKILRCKRLGTESVGGDMATADDEHMTEQCWALTFGCTSFRFRFALEKVR